VWCPEGAGHVRTGYYSKQHLPPKFYMSGAASESKAKARGAPGEPGGQPGTASMAFWRRFG
jgi:hypothetical protein